VRWARKIDDVRRKSEFYPDLDKRVLFEQGYIAEHSGHSRGATVDLTLIQRADGSEVDMGGPFDFFSPKSWPSDRSVSVQAQQNRALLAQAMTRGGFRPYDKEWWHFTLANEPFPDTYFDFPCVEANASRVTVQGGETSHLSDLDEDFPVFDHRPIGFDRNHARRGDDLSGPDIELSVVKIALDDVAFDIAFRQRARPVGAGIIGHKELAVDVEHREDQVVFLDSQSAAHVHVGGIA
jgi:hypothetical protein